MVLAAAVSACSVVVCEEPVKGRGLCKAHYQRLLDKGDPGTSPIRKKKPGSKCSVVDCDRVHYARFFCRAHYLRGQVGAATASPIAAHIKPDDEVTYHALHKRLFAKRGPASAHPCRNCGTQAAHWAYQHNDADEKTDPETGMPYSLDMTGSYEPMCHSCHIIFDRSLVSA